MKKVLSIILAAVMLMSVFTAVDMSVVTAVAAEIVTSGKCGENVTYKLDSDGLLVISGNGDMTTSMWGISETKNVIIENGVTNM